MTAPVEVPRARPARRGDRRFGLERIDVEQFLHRQWLYAVAEHRSNMDPAQDQIPDSLQRSEIRRREFRGVRESAQ
jgi:chloramphenicol 3-O-phosphotransferase